jgi:MoxR-like ATPase
VEQAGTYKLPEAQLDRFLMKTSVGYPDRTSARQILAGSANPDRTKNLQAMIATAAVAEMADLVRENHVDDAVLDYVQRLTEATREDPDTSLGVSTRGSIALVRACRVWAAAQGRTFVTPDDVKELAGPVWGHRLMLSPEAEFAGSDSSTVINRMLESVAAPQLRGVG